MGKICSVVRELGWINCRTERECYVRQVQDVYSIVCVQVNAESALGRAVGNGTTGSQVGSARPGREAERHERQVYDVLLSIMVYVKGPRERATAQPG